MVMVQDQDYQVDASKFPTEFSQFLTGRQRCVRFVVMEDDAFPIDKF